MSVKGEKYASMKAMKMHEGSEGKKERMMEYGKKAVKKSTKKAMPKKMGKRK